ncbi:MAG: putative Fe-S cluster assembly protein SufT [Candidatus Binatia bacterium]
MSSRLSEPIVLRRDVEAVQIPSGFAMILEKDTEVRITQSLGGSHTVMTPQGLARIAGADADALGLEAPSVAEASSAGGETAEEVEKAVWDQLRTCFDPEIPVNIVDLGLVYSCLVTPVPDGYRVEVKFTLTAPGCGMGDWLRQDMQTKIEGLPGVKETDVEVVFEPPWNQTMMSEAARLELGML